LRCKGGFDLPKVGGGAMYRGKREENILALGEGLWEKLSFSKGKENQRFRRGKRPKGRVLVGVFLGISEKTKRIRGDLATLHFPPPPGEGFFFKKEDKLKGCECQSYQDSWGGWNYLGTRAT